MVGSELALYHDLPLSSAPSLKQMHGELQTWITDTRQAPPENPGDLRESMGPLSSNMYWTGWPFMGIIGICRCSSYLVGGDWYMIFFPRNIGKFGNNHPNWLLYFSEGQVPPTRYVITCNSCQCSPAHADTSVWSSFLQSWAMRQNYHEPWEVLV